MRLVTSTTVCALLLASAVPATAAQIVSAFNLANGTDLSGLPGAGQNRLGGIGSDLVYDAGRNVFYGLGDRGPGGGVLPYAPRFQTFSLDINRTTGAINGFTLQGTTIFRQPNGASYNGLNPTLLNGSPAILGASFDPEGLAQLPNGNLLVSDEYGPSVYEFTAAGQFVRAFETPANLLPRAGSTPNFTDGRPTITSGRQDNRGYEGLTVTPDGRTAYAVLQDPLVNEGANNDGRTSRNVRIVAFDVTTGQSTGQFIYQLESLADLNARTSQPFGATAQGRNIGVSAIQSLGNNRFLVLERDNRGLGVEDPTAATDVASKRVFLIDLTGATNVANVSLAGTNTLPAGVVPATKTATPFLDIAAGLRALGLTIPEKIEGFAFGPRLNDGGIVLILATDNDFSVTQNGSGTQFDVCTSGPGGVSSQVALGAGCPTGQALIPNLFYSVRLSAAEFNALTGVPEPGTWAMLVLGFGGVGYTLRRRRVGVRSVA
jgi:hypothetical protein